jgi:hypothetical protein
MVSICRMLCGLCYYGNYYTCVNLVTTALGRRSDPSNTFVSYWYAALMEIPIWILPFILQGHLRVCQVALTVPLLCAAVSSIWHAILPTGESKKCNLKVKYRWLTVCTVLLKQSLLAHACKLPTIFVLNQWVIQLYKKFRCTHIFSHTFLPFLWPLPTSSAFLSHLIYLPYCHACLPSILSFSMTLKVYVNGTQNISSQE